MLKKEKGLKKEGFADERKLAIVEKTRNIAHEFSGKGIRNGFLKKETQRACYLQLRSTH